MTDEQARRIVDELEDDVVDLGAAAGDDDEPVAAEDASSKTPGVEPTD